jgi:predicted dehydrogenase
MERSDIRGIPGFRFSLNPGYESKLIMIGIGIVGCNYGRNVLLPAFRSDVRCEVVALAGSEAARTAEIARAANVSRGYGVWRALIEDKSVAAVAIAVPPALQGSIAQRALALGKPVFAEKPLADSAASAHDMLEAARASARPTMIDFNFPELATWQRAKALLDGGRIGALRHVVVTWNTENAATRLRLKNWKTQGEGSGSGLLGNFVCHCLYYLEWFCGSICGLGGRIFPLPGEATQGSIALALAFASGAGASLQMSCASYLGSGHRIEFYGGDGTLVLFNPATDYFRGFTLMAARRGDACLQPVEVTDEFGEAADPRIVPVSRLVRRFLDACESGGGASPGFAEGYRVQCLMEAAWQAHASGRWMDVPLRHGERQA